MRLLACKLLADANVHPDVVDFLRRSNCDVCDVYELGMGQATDEEIIQKGSEEDRLIVTHDRDFGRLAVLMRKPMRGIVYLRPGHIESQFTIDTLQAINGRDLDLSPPIILVAHRRGDYVRVRLRR